MTCVTDSCRQGRDRCPTPDQCCERTRRQQEAEARWTDGIGYEAADPERAYPRGAMPIQFVEPEGEFLEKTVVWIVSAVAVVAILAAVIPAF